MYTLSCMNNQQGPTVHSTGKSAQHSVVKSHMEKNVKKRNRSVFGITTSLTVYL